MGDMGDAFRDHREHMKERREKRTVANAEALAKLGILAREQSKNVFRVDTERGAVMYYPGSNTWQHKGKTYHGNVNDFAGWVTNFQRKLAQERQCSDAS